MTVPRVHTDSTVRHISIDSLRLDRTTDTETGPQNQVDHLHCQSGDNSHREKRYPSSTIHYSPKSARHYLTQQRLVRDIRPINRQGTPHSHSVDRYNNHLALLQRHEHRNKGAGLDTPSDRDKHLLQRDWPQVHGDFASSGDQQTTSYQGRLWRRLLNTPFKIQGNVGPRICGWLGEGAR